ncbi:MAG: hypothetical protein ACI4WM_04120 [Erysipelotrichaceae bacterium]
MFKLIKYLLLLPFYMVILVFMMFGWIIKAMLWFVVILFGIMII